MVSSPHDAGLPAAWVLPNGSPRWARSRGVDGYFRVFTTSGSGSWVRRASSDLSPLDVVPAVFPEGRLFRGLRHETVRSPRTPGDSPLELHLSLRVGPSARPPPNALLPEGNTRPARAPLMRFAAPSAPRVDASTLRRPTPRCPRDEAPGFACPVRSALAVSHDLDGLLRIRPLQVSPDGAHGVLFLQGLSRSRMAGSLPSAPSPRAVPLPPLRRRICIRPPRSTAVDFRVSVRGPTVAAHLRFPADEGSFPSWNSLWDLAPTAPRGGWPFGPVTYSVVNDRRCDGKKLLGRRTAINAQIRALSMGGAYDSVTLQESRGNSFQSLFGAARTGTERGTALHRAIEAGSHEVRKHPR